MLPKNRIVITKKAYPDMKLSINIFCNKILITKIKEINTPKKPNKDINFNGKVLKEVIQSKDKLTN